LDVGNFIILQGLSGEGFEVLLEIFRIVLFFLI